VGAQEDAEMDMKRQRRHAERLRVKLLDVNYFAEKKSPQVCWPLRFRN
jgi:hypothetical protein